ncbi:hypothetical protein DFH07DRAFT_1005165 [Mycena maculata]|uniref:Uncharacterized protein n=1 Tax=Mycena maculata TaxID=230809 RepID=A0AAD7HN35_9AGAR|nr:hypothetical protein DFH07DRAFT_1005165 [Mycena maculata]
MDRQIRALTTFILLLSLTTSTQQRRARMPHSIFAVLVSLSSLLLLLYTPASRAQANRTVDDFSPEITYSPAADVTHTNTTGFDITKLYNGTIGLMNASDNAVNMTLSFTGTAIWLFTAKPQTSQENLLSDAYTIYIDGASVESDADVRLAPDAIYENPAYSNAHLPLGAHIVTLSALRLMYFDYAIFTSNDSTPETTIPPVQPPSGAPTASQTSKPISHIAIITGVVVAVLILLGAGIAVCIFLHRRRARVPHDAPHYSVGGGKASAVYPGGPGQPAYDTAEGALFHVPTSVSQLTSTPASIPIPPTQGDTCDPHQFQTQPQSQSEYSPQPQTQAESPYASPSANAGPYTLQSQSPSEHQPPDQDPFAHIQPQSVATQRMLAEQGAAEAEYGPPQQAYQPQYNQNQFSQSPGPAELRQQQSLPLRDPRELRYEQPHDPNLERVMEKHRVAEVEYGHAHARTATGWPDERPGIDVGQTPTWSSQGGPPTRTSSAAASGGGSAMPETPRPSAAESSSSAHGAAALSTIAAEMAALRAQVARLESERREEQPPAYI